MSLLRVNQLTNTGGTGPTYAPGHVIQVQSVTKADAFTTGSQATWVDVTGLSVTITPLSASSKILVFGHVALAPSITGYAAQGRIVRGATVIGNGTAVGNRQGVSMQSLNSGTGNWASSPLAFSHLDSPATTSATTYKIQVWGESGSTPLVNRSINDNDQIFYGRLSSSITVMEIAQ